MQAISTGWRWSMEYLLQDYQGHQLGVVISLECKLITSAETLDSKVLFYWEVRDTLRAEIGIDFILGKTGLLTWEITIFISSQIYHTVLIQPILDNFIHRITQHMSRCLYSSIFNNTRQDDMQIMLATQTVIQAFK